MKYKISIAAAGLKALREFAGLTLDEVAAEAGTSASHLSNVENGKVSASPEYIGRISGAISKSLSTGLSTETGDAVVAA